MSDLPFTALPTIYKTCGEDRSRLYDVGATGSITLGKETKATMQSYMHLQEITQPSECLKLICACSRHLCHLALCNPPCQNKAPCVRDNQCNCSPSFTGNRCENPGKTL